MDVAVFGPLLEELDQAAANANGGLAGVVSVAFGQGPGIEQQQEINVGRIIELVATELAHRDHRKALRPGVGNPFSDGRRHCFIDRVVSKVGQERRHLFQRQFS